MTRINETPSKTIKPSVKESLIFIISLFILSRLFFFYKGIRFDTNTLFCFWQLIDPLLLKNNLFQSIYYLHIQPPLFSLFLGSILKLFPGSYALVFNFIYLAIGLTLAVSIFFTLTNLKVSNRLSVILTVLFMVNPTTILYENFLLYDYPTMLFLCLSALFLHRFLSSSKLRDGGTFFALLSLIVLTKSVFHIAWFIFFVCVLLFYQRKSWKRIVLIAIVPFILIAFVYLKNLYLFGIFNGSSWMGLSLSRFVAFERPPEDELKALINQGKISKFSLIQAYSSLGDYQDSLPKTKKTNIAVLDQQIKSTGCANFNNIEYVGISKQYLKDTVYILFSHPEIYLKGLTRAYYLYFLPATEFSYLNMNGNKNHIHSLIRLYNFLFCGQVLPHRGYDQYKKNDIFSYYKYKFLSAGVLLIMGFMVSMAYGLRVIFKTLSKKHSLRKPEDLPFALTVLFLCATIIYVTLSCNFLSLGENFRYRLSIDPFILILLGLAINKVFPLK